MRDLITNPTSDLDEGLRAFGHLQNLVSARKGVAMHRLHADDLPTPRISISAGVLHHQSLSPLPSVGSSFRGRLTFNPYAVFHLTDKEIGHVIDHEMAHYVQLRRNKRVTRLEKILHWSEYEDFKEGFATFASSLTNGGVEEPVKESLRMVFSGQRPHPDLATYVRGYLRFLAVAKATSVEEAIQHGLSCSLAEWRRAAAKAKASLGLDSVDSLFWA